MPDPDADERHSERLLTALIWGGVALAPIAVLVALVGGGGPSLRFAVVLLAVAIVLIGSSLLIRNDPVLVRLDLDDRLARHTEELRAELRDEIAAAARATHHRVQSLQDDLTRLQGPATPAARPIAAQRAPGATSRAVPVPGAAAAVARAVPVPPAAVARAVAVPPASAAPPYGGRGRVPAASVEPASRHSTPPHDDASRRGDDPLRRHEVGDGGGRRARRRRAREDDHEAESRRHAGPDSYESERYGPDSQARPVEQGDWREPASYGDDELGRW
jgi:hypothetical protein